MIYKFQKLLVEGNIYIITYFGVGTNIGFFRTTRHDFRINFQYQTSVKPSEASTISLYGLTFIPFDEIFQSQAELPFLVGNDNYCFICLQLLLYLY